MSQLKQVEFCLFPPVCSTQALNRLDDDHLHSWGCSLLSRLFQLWKSSRHTLTDIPNNVLPTIGAALSPIKFTHKMSHQNHILKKHRRILPGGGQRGEAVPVLSLGLAEQQNDPHEWRAQGACHISACPSFISIKSLRVYHSCLLRKGVCLVLYTGNKRDLWKLCVE